MHGKLFKLNLNRETSLNHEIYVYLCILHFEPSEERIDFTMMFFFFLNAHSGSRIVPIYTNGNSKNR